MSLDSLALSAARKSSLLSAALTYHESLPEAASYLEARGLTEETCAGRLLGFVAEPAPTHERFTGMLSIPYMVGDSCLALKFRRIEGEGPKYDQPSAQVQRMYNAGALASGGELVVVCEGELDAIMAAQLGYIAVGCPGTSAWQPHWSRCFGDFDRVVILADHDAKPDGSDPGRKHAEKLAKTLGADIVLPPAGEDLNDWVLSAGADAVRKAIG